jgi:hypothetical protein
VRQYSVRERVLFAILGSGVFLPAAAFMTYMTFDGNSLGRGSWWLAVVGAWVAVAICVKIAITGTSTRFLERPALNEGTNSERPKDPPPTA